jgi:hypothetical protein
LLPGGGAGTVAESARATAEGRSDAR